MTAFYILEIVYSMSQTMLGPMLPQIQSTYDISVSDNGMLTLFQGMGGIVAGIVTFFVSDRYNKIIMMNLVFLLYTAMLFVAHAMPPYTILLCAFFVIGLGTKSFDALVNANVSEISRPERRGMFLILLHACFGLGALVAPIIVSILLSRTSSIGQTFLTIFLLAFGAWAVCMAIQRSGLRLRHSGDSITAPAKKNLRQVIASKVVILAAFVGFLFVGFAMAVSMWLPSFMMLEHDLSKVSAAIIVSLLWCGVIAGRIFFSWLSIKYPIRPMLLVGNATGAAILFLSFAIDIPLVYGIAYLAAGFCMSATMPLAYAFAGKFFPGNAGGVSSVIVLLSCVGQALLPFLCGHLIEAIGYHLAICFMNFAPVLTVVIVFLLPKEERR
ncbi:MAG TPA: MFS transporter [Anaerovoracaceae bacterium]|nr:MFS transporter [Anaerovoracaceae bacterium]